MERKQVFRMTFGIVGSQQQSKSNNNINVGRQASFGSCRFNRIIIGTVLGGILVFCFLFDNVTLVSISTMFGSSLSKSKITVAQQTTKETASATSMETTNDSWKSTEDTITTAFVDYNNNSTTTDNNNYNNRDSIDLAVVAERDIAIAIQQPQEEEEEETRQQETQQQPIETAAVVEGGVAEPDDGVAVVDTDETTSIYNGIDPVAYTPWPIDAMPLPCYTPEKEWKEDWIQDTPTKTGFLYVKPYKTGSSTCSGINLRISESVAKRQLKGKADICKCRYDHGWATFRFQNRKRDQSFLWTIIREPTKRAISSFFHFGVSRFGLTPTDHEFIHYLNVSNVTIFQDDYLKTLYVPTVFDRTKHDPIHVTNYILRDYNFIGITERMHESAVALMMLLNLTLGDILYLSAKTNGGYDDGGGNGCVLIHPTFVSEPVQEYLQTPSWQDIVQYDARLYHAANASLDKTIEALGQEQVYANVEKLKYALQLAQERCLPNTVFPCDENGVFHPEEETDCIWKDSGCGTECLDGIATELGLW